MRIISYVISREGLFMLKDIITTGLEEDINNETKTYIEKQKNNTPLTPEEFYDKFRKDFISSNEFIKVFLSKLTVEGVSEFKEQDLIKFLFESKQNEKYSELLADINFYFNGVRYICQDISANINVFMRLGSLSIPRITNYPTHQINFSCGSVDKTINDFFAKYPQCIENLNCLVLEYRNIFLSNDGKYNSLSKSNNLNPS